MIEGLPYEPRPGQDRLIRFITDSLESGRHSVVESGTGTGKTVSALAATVPFAKRNGKRVVFLTRTKSQQKQIMSELRAMSSVIDVFGIAVQGRSVTTCPRMASDPELRTGSPEEMSRLCSHLKSKKDGTGCPYFDSMRDADIDVIVDGLRDLMPDPETFASLCAKDGYCPYEMMKAAIPFADVISAPYTFMVMPNIRRHFLGWMNATEQDIIIVVDEAHNLPDYLRDAFTSEYTVRALSYAEAEAKREGDPEVSAGITVTDVVSAMRSCFVEANMEYLRDTDGLIPYGFLQESLMGSLHVPSPILEAVFRNMSELGEIIRERLKSQHRLPRSHIGSLGDFLQFWTRCDDMSYVRLINGGENHSLEAYCMDPYEAAAPFRDCYASVHMSGTLEPIPDYVMSLGLERCNHASFPSPFDPDNLLTLYVDDVTTRHNDLQLDPDNIDRIMDHIVDLVNGVGRNTAVFFPSYEMMNRFVVKGLQDRLEGDVYTEIRGMSQAELMDTVDGFRSSTGGILFAVTGGRISEGLDFPSRDLELAIIVGLPYPRPSAKKDALIRYCQYRFDDGWNYVVRMPMARKMRQARGRLIRSEDDRGAAVVLDSRALQIPGFGAILSHDPVNDCNSFFDGLVTPTELGIRRRIVADNQISDDHP
ncbi:MAG: ATP-dependent DNA helicase [Candidatus Methanomethylophilaceae archaeon]|nr:ATP-dependent DNA helicase [Candidatus Methanomethylophilaceae archaeon]MDY5872477.1 ATP-dependent DNA helicase [Candidatus Methanomethylophilaceae archaeon]